MCHDCLTANIKDLLITSKSFNTVNHSYLYLFTTVNDPKDSSQGRDIPSLRASVRVSRTNITLKIFIISISP